MVTHWLGRDFSFWANLIDLSRREEENIDQCFTLTPSRGVVRIDWDIEFRQV